MLKNIVYLTYINLGGMDINMKKIIFFILFILVLKIDIGLADLSDQNLYLLSNDYFEEIRGLGDSYMVKDLDHHYWYLLNKNGDRVNSAAYDEVLNYEGSYIAVSKKLSDGKTGYGVIDYTGKEIIPLKYSNIQILKIHGYIKAEDFNGKCFLYIIKTGEMKEVPNGEIIELPDNIMIYNKYTTQDKAINQGIRMNLFVYDKNMNFVFDYKDSIHHVDTRKYKNISNDLLITSRLTNYWDLNGIINTKNGRGIAAENDSIDIKENYVIIKKLRPEKNDPSEWNISISGVKLYKKYFTCKIYDYNLIEQTHLYEDFELVDVLYNEYSKETYMISYDKKLDEYGIRDLDGTLIHSTKYEPNSFISKNVLEISSMDYRGYIYINNDNTAFEVLPDKYFELYHAMDDNLIIARSVSGSALINARTKEIIIPDNIYNQITAIAPGYAIIYNGSKYGIIDYNADIVLPLEYEVIQATMHDTEYLKAKKNNYENIFSIDKLEFIFDWKYKEILEYEDYYSAKTADGFVDLISFDYETMWNIKADFAWYYNGTVDIFKNGMRQIYKTDAGEPSNWSIYGVNQMNSLGLTPNKIQGLYQKNITRSEFCDIIANIIYKKKGLSSDEIMSIIEKAEDFKDTDSQSIAFCNAAGIVKGRGNGVFAPDASISREEAAVIINNTLKYLDITQAENQSTVNPADYDKVSGWAKDAVSSVISKRLIVGVDGNKYDPQGLLSREQAIVICYRLMDK